MLSLHAPSLWLLIIFICCSIRKALCVPPVKVFILAGQSNMWGKASIEHLRDLSDGTLPEYAKYMDGSQFVNRTDVRMIFNERRGDVSDLRVGFGTDDEATFGPEIGFGWTVGDFLEEPVLVIKVAWGSTSLAESWRSPSAAANSSTYPGLLYNWTMDMVQDATVNLDRYFPNNTEVVAQQGVELEIAGFVWLQGWTDLMNDDFRDSYESNLQFFVSDMLASFGSNMPFLIGELGQGGEDGGVHRFRQKQLEMRSTQKRVADSFPSNVKFVTTHQYVVSGRFAARFDGLHHYYGRADTILQIGNALGREMIQQVTTTSPSESPSKNPTLSPPPSLVPTITPVPTVSDHPSNSPSVEASSVPSTIPTATPSLQPSLNPSITPPSDVPSGHPSVAPSSSHVPSKAPSSSHSPSDAPTKTLSLSPSGTPSGSSFPSNAPSKAPSHSLSPTEFSYQLNCSAFACGNLADGEDQQTVCVVGDDTNVTECVATNSSSLMTEGNYCGACETPSVNNVTPVWCFSGTTKVDVLGKGPINMKDLQVGDSVHAGGQKYETVYAFGHFNRDMRATFLQFTFEEEVELLLEISEDHLVFIDQDRAIPASLVHVGDYVLDGFGKRVEVKGITSIMREGVFAPFTSSGSIVVGGIQASSYVTLQPNESDLVLRGFRTGLSHQWLAHAFLLPYRTACTWFVCNDRYTSDGVNVWVDYRQSNIISWFLRQAASVQPSLSS